MDKRLQRVDDFMKKRFVEKVKLLETYGPVQMCVFNRETNLIFTNCLCKGMPCDYICDSCVIGQKRAKNVGTKICFGDKMCFVGRSK